MAVRKLFWITGISALRDSAVSHDKLLQSFNNYKSNVHIYTWIIYLWHNRLLQYRYNICYTVYFHIIMYYYIYSHINSTVGEDGTLTLQEWPYIIPIEEYCLMIWIQYCTLGIYQPFSHESVTPSSFQTHSPLSWVSL